MSVLFPAPQEEDPAVAASSPQETALQRGRQALEDGRLQAAEDLFRTAAWGRETRGAALAGLLQVAAAKSDPDQQALAALRLWWFQSNDRGLAKLDSDVRAALPRKDGAPAKLAKARASAVRTLLSATNRLPEKASLSRALWLAAATEVVAEGNPLLEQAGSQVGLWEQEDCRPDTVSVLRDAQHAVEQALAAGRYAEALAGARWLHGCAVQASFKHLKEEVPDLSAIRAAASAAMNRARFHLREQNLGFYSLKELGDLSPEEKAAASRRHEDWGRAAATDSPNGWYRVETVCGLTTLFACADAVENHHRRLARWFGRDPFENRPGTVRLVPHAHGLEAEGSPFWWAGGFQGGDTTTLQFTMSDRESLGRGLTHELTHRFDGALYPHGLPSWLVEGKAVYTAGAYRHEKDMETLGRYFGRGAAYATLNKGYHRPGPLRELIQGKQEEYRDNYSAGHALFSYLHTWMPPGEDRFLYRDALQDFMNRPPKGGAEAWFVGHFADGKEGRPQGLEAFCDRFGEFLHAFIAKEPPSWVGDYPNPGGRGAPRVFDTMTWPNLRRRVKPGLGEFHAGAMGRWLQSQGQEEKAIAMLEWARSRQDLGAEDLELLQRLYRREGKAGEATAVALERFRLGVGPAPDLSQSMGSLAAPHRALLKLWRAYRAEAEGYRGQGLLLTAGSLEAKASALARVLGLKEEFEEENADAVADCDPPVSLGQFGWETSTLGDTPSTGPWYVESDFLILGRSREEGATTDRSRSVAARPIFLHRQFPVQGSYSLHAQIFPQTTFVDFSIVLGFQGGNRYAEFRLSSGDWDYSTGRDAVEEVHGLRLQFGDGRMRDQALWGHRRRFDLPFEKTQAGPTSIEITLTVSGAGALFFVDGEAVAFLRNGDGQAFEGMLGFAVHRGAIRIQQPAFQRHHKFGDLHCDCLAWPEDWHPMRPSAWSWETMEGRRAVGLDLGPEGSFLVWVPYRGMPEEMSLEDAREIAAYQAFTGVRPAEEIPGGLPRRWLVAFPQPLMDAVEDPYALKTREPVAEYFVHPRHPGLDLWVDRSFAGELPLEREILGEPEDLLFFIDADGVIRAVDELDALVNWLRVRQGY